MNECVSEITDKKERPQTVGVDETHRAQNVNAGNWDGALLIMDPKRLYLQSFALSATVLP